MQSLPLRPGCVKKRPHFKLFAEKGPGDKFSEIWEKDTLCVPVAEGNRSVIKPIELKLARLSVQHRIKKNAGPAHIAIGHCEPVRSAGRREHFVIHDMMVADV